MKETFVWLMGFVCGWLAGAFLNGCNDSQEELTVEIRRITDSVHVVIYDTIPVEKLVPVDSVVLRYDTVRVASLPPIALPITQKHYRDTAFEAWISGYNVSLDSMQLVHQRETTMISNHVNTTAATKMKSSRWVFSAGVALTPDGVAPYVGVGFRLFDL